MTAPLVSVVVPYYDQPQMLEKHFAAWAQYDTKTLEAMKLIVVDDGSPQYALDQLRLSFMLKYAPFDLEVYRIKKDIPWNRGGARNLGSKLATTKWLLHMDIDHVLPPSAADALARVIDRVKAENWYRFRRFRVGEADETRNKDALPRNAKFGEIKPHIDSYLCTKELYWRSSGYDEDYSGCLGGGSPFLRRLETFAPVRQLIDPICLHVYTRHACADANAKLDRSTGEFTKRRKAKERAGNTTPKNPIRFEWERVL